MNIVRPTPITPDVLTYSSIPEPDVGDGPAWDAGTTYQVGDVVHILSVHRKFKAVTENTGVDPTEPVPIGEVPTWVDMGPTNRWAMFDGTLGTSSVTTGDITVRLNPIGSITSLVLFGLAGRTLTVRQRDTPGGTVIFEETITLDGTEITSFYDWFFEPYRQMDEVVIEGLRGAFLASEIEIHIEATDQSSIAEVAVGRYIQIGDTTLGARAGIIDFSRKVRDQNFGGMTIVQRGYARRTNLTVLTLKTDFKRIYNILAELRAVPCIYIGQDGDSDFEPLTVYGFYRDFDIAVDYPDHHLLLIEIEGII